MNRPVAVIDDLIGQSPGIAAVRDRIARLLSRAGEVRRLPPVLVQGETGTGKGLVARALHRAGPRAEGPFVDVNCAAIPETLLEAEMFGFERGAFTDARQAKRGLFQAAHRGTLFLDEVGLLPEGLQAKLLKVLEERAVRRLGSTQSEAVDVWIIAATNADLLAATRAHRFREDLYHRLAVLTLHLPPLRERGRDVILLAEHLLGRACADYGLAVKTLADDARAALLAYRWPGNVRELGNVLERVALVAEGSVVTAAMLALPAGAPGDAPPAVPAAPIPLAVTVESVEREHLLAALRETDWNVTRAAERLGISRNTLRYRIEKHGLRPRGAAPPIRRRQAQPAHGPPAAAVEPARPPTPAPAAVRWERRRLTLLRAMVSGTVGVPQRLDASRVIELCVDKVHSFDGRIESLSATGIVGVFGLEPVEDAPRRAANAALAIQRAATQARESAGEPWAVRIAIHVGHFMIGRVGDAARIDETVKREAWALTDSLVAVAEPGGIVVTESAVPFLERRYDLAALPHRDPVAGGLYRLGRGERPQFDPGRRLAAFVGRRRELALLRSLLDVATSRHGQVVGVVGEAGIGKSRLLFEFRQSLGADPITYREARCVEYGRTIPYLPVLEIIAQNFRIQEADTPDVIAAKIRQGLAGVGLDPVEGAPYLLHVLGLREGAEALAFLSPEAIKARSFETLRALTLHGSRRRPIVFAVEDLQWIDSVSDELVASLVDSLAGAPILFVATYRPGCRPAWLDKSYATQIALGPLSVEDSLALVRSARPAATVSEPLARTIVDKAQGNPFFLEELTRTLSGGLDASVPETIHEALLARIDRVGEEPRRVLRLAAVIGREVSLRLLRAVWEGSDPIEPHLRELVRLEVLYEQAGPPDPGYVFTHAMTQEVAYRSLLDEERRRDHGRVGAALEALYAGRTGEIVERLAHHYGRSGDDAKAVDYALLTAAKAQSRWANAEALAYFTAALARLEAMPDSPANRRRRIDAVVKQAETKFALGQHAEHIEALDRIREIVDAAGDPPRRAAWYYWTGFLHGLTGGRPEVSIALCREAVAIADAEGLAEIRAFAECCLSQVYLMAGDLRNALESGRRALEIFEATRNVWWSCRALWALTAAANALGSWRESLDFCRRARELGESVNDLRLRTVGWWRTGWAHIMRGAPDEGVQCCETALALSPNPYDAAMARAARGYGLVRGGDVRAGTAELDEAVAWFSRSQLPFTRLFFALPLAEGWLRQGDAPRARALLEEVRETSRALGYGYTEGLATRLLGEAWVAEAPDRAAAHLAAAATRFEEAGARDSLARVWVAQGALRRRAGDAEGARALLERALRTFEALGTLDEPAYVRSALAAPGKGADATTTATVEGG
jgi:DNA-binding NtrC family response regulator/tetratricopeptide (TPR) repeat protein